MVNNFFALTAGLAATASAFDCSGSYFSMFNRKGLSMSAQRLDPALEPGVQSAHLHNFDGGNGIALDTTFASLDASTCTTARVKADNSLYWRPALYWNGNGTGFYRVTEQIKMYYKYQDGAGAAEVSEFPENFQMIAGDQLKRSDDGKNPAGIRWACHEPQGTANGNTKDPIFTKGGFPTGFTGCNYGLASELTFPSCWNGEKIDPKNPSAHTAYPNGSGKGTEACPEGFRKARFPTIFIEFWYDIKQFNGQYKATDNPWVLSNGDSTGFGMHGDFKNGWKKGVLAKAVSPTGGCRCGCGCGPEELKQCFGADGINDEKDENFAKCSAKPLFAGEDNLVVQKLPGCNPIQAGPGRAEVKTGPDCASSAPAPGNNNNGGAASSSAAAPSAPASSSSKAAAPSTKPTSTKKDGQMSIQTQNAGNKQPAVSAKAQDANGNVVYVTQTVVSYQTVAARRHRRHSHRNRMH
ncbi:hypothetical protein DM02DRAFT_244260 [Periconia macrospinosa]|uniref:DUF1996 domain-containing protein n=1 Tax=Periconia macrospinosa TaxID=97972 RepID=A0A2V1D570_9PLEO|nr:hypothetical protein DM02DRAFT_244260 [Periconia macrospinosa]